MNRSIVRSSLLLASLGWLTAHGADLKPETVTAWDQYIQGAEAKMQERTAGSGSHFLWTDETPERAASIKQGQIAVEPMAPHGYLPVHNGLIHHWIGAAFLPNASLPEVLGLITDYGHYANVYGAPVVDAHLIGREGDQDRFAIRTMHKVLFVTAAMETRYASKMVQLDAKRVYIMTHSTGIYDLENYGQPDERAASTEHGSGYAWRLYTIARYEQRDGGVYAELEVIALSRDIPAALRSLVRPVVAKLSRNSLGTTLNETREALSPATHAARQGAPTPGQGFVAGGHR
jgi:hypothetical protein